MDEAYRRVGVHPAAGIASQDVEQYEVAHEHDRRGDERSVRAKRRDPLLTRHSRCRNERDAVSRHRHGPGRAAGFFREDQRDGKRGCQPKARSEQEIEEQDEEGGRAVVDVQEDRVRDEQRREGVQGGDERVLDGGPARKEPPQQPVERSDRGDSQNRIRRVQQRWIPWRHVLAQREQQRIGDRRMAAAAEVQDVERLLYRLLHAIQIGFRVPERDEIEVRRHERGEYESDQHRSGGLANGTQSPVRLADAHRDVRRHSCSSWTDHHRPAAWPVSRITSVAVWLSGRAMAIRG